jgi:glycosyltransferase involved in cell wall biosynthesis
MSEVNKLKIHSDNWINVVVLTTSYPIRNGPPSGPFVKRLVEYLPKNVKATVLTPCIQYREDYCEKGIFRVKCFRYAPKRWQRLAHSPGGIPVALQSNPLLYLILPWLLISMVFTCWRETKDTDLIHANWSINGVLAGIVAGLRRIPLVTTLRGEDVSRSVNSKLFHWILGKSLKVSSCVVTVSDAFHAQIVEQFPCYASKVRVVHNGIERHLLKRTIRPITHSVIRIVMIGSLIPRKDISTFLYALTNAPEPDSIQAVIVGDGPERNTLELLSMELGLASIVTFTGAVLPDDVGEYLNNADILVLCSQSEGRPNVVLEAMAAGVVVVATAIQGVTEIITDGHNGLLFKPGDATGLLRHLERLRTETEFHEKLAHEARVWIQEENLFWDTTGHNYAEIYRESIDKKKICVD